MLHAVIGQHLEAFLQEVSARGDESGLPRVVEQEFREFLTCGVLAHGFTRLRCGDCRFERLLPFSCKGRGFCPSCGGCRMAERAATLLDRVLPPTCAAISCALRWPSTGCACAATAACCSRSRPPGGTAPPTCCSTPSSCWRSLRPSRPAPRFNLLLYHGVLAPHARGRRYVVGSGRPAPAGSEEPGPDPRPRRDPTPSPSGAWTWPALMRRVFDLDVLACPRCGGRLRIIATVQDPDAVRAILATSNAPSAATRLAPLLPLLQ